MAHSQRCPSLSVFYQMQSMSFTESWFIDCSWSYVTMKLPVTSDPGLSTCTTLGKSLIFLNLISFSWRNYSPSKISSLSGISGTPQGKSYLLVNHPGPQFTFSAPVVNPKAGSLMLLLLFSKLLSPLLVFFATQSPCSTLGQGLS